MRYKKRGFTLLELLISIMLLSMVLMALYKSADILRASNKNLFNHLNRTSNIIKGAKTLYMDILQSDSNISIDTNKEFHHIIIEKTNHSLYGLSSVKVVWLVHKEKKTLLRLEGGKFDLPLRSEQRVEIDEIVDNMELFNIYISKSKREILVVMKAISDEPQTFIVQNLSIKERQRVNRNNHRGANARVPAQNRRDRNITEILE